MNHLFTIKNDGFGKSCDAVNDAGLVHLAAHTNLRKLSLERCIQLTHAVRHLTPLIQLRQLNVRGCVRMDTTLARSQFEMLVQTRK